MGRVADKTYGPPLVQTSCWCRIQTKLVGYYLVFTWHLWACFFISSSQTLVS